MNKIYIQEIYSESKSCQDCMLGGQVGCHAFFWKREMFYCQSDALNPQVVHCMNEHVSKGRLYQNTPLGLEILKMIEKNRK